MAFLVARSSDKRQERTLHIIVPLCFGIVGFIIAMSTNVLAARCESSFDQIPLLIRTRSLTRRVLFSRRLPLPHGSILLRIRLPLRLDQLFFPSTCLQASRGDRGCERFLSVRSKSSFLRIFPPLLIFPSDELTSFPFCAFIRTSPEPTSTRLRGRQPTGSRLESLSPCSSRPSPSSSSTDGLWPLPTRGSSRPRSVSMEPSSGRRTLRFLTVSDTFSNLVTLSSLYQYTY